jgi:hypothetical protein
VSIARNLSILADYLNSAGTLNTAGGGTASTLTATQGGIAYGDGTKLLFTGAGTAGQYLQSTGTGAPSWTTINALPTQTGNSGKYLTTDGSAASWATVNSLPTQTSNSGKFLTTDGSAASWAVVPTTIISSTAPNSPSAGTKWVNTTSGVEYTYYVDIDSSQWIETGPVSIISGLNALPIYLNSGTTVSVSVAQGYFAVMDRSGSYTSIAIT